MTKDRLSMEAIMESALKQTGFNNWGDDNFQKPLQILIDSFKESNKDKVKQLVFRNELMRLLINRLMIEEDFRRYPEIMDVPINKPLFIVGLGRTGSTLLFNLLAQDPNCRALLYWELRRPSPPPDIKTRETDPRIALAEKDLFSKYQVLPGLLKTHESMAKKPEECCYLLFHTFMSRQFYFWNVPAYMEWLITQNFIPAYQYYKKLLKLMLFKTPGSHLVLKDPSHFSYIDILLTLFPDAYFVWIHRNVTKAMTSFFSMEDEYDYHVSNAQRMVIAENLAHDLDRAISVREERGAKQLYDVAYTDLVNDPIGIIKSIYKYFNMQYTQEMDDKMEKWLYDNPKNKHGKHEYSLEQYGLFHITIGECFNEYTQRYKDYLK